MDDQQNPYAAPLSPAKREPPQPTFCERDAWDDWGNRGPDFFWPIWIFGVLISLPFILLVFAYMLRTV